jgi:hypothetical protein
MASCKVLGLRPMMKPIQLQKQAPLILGRPRQIHIGPCTCDVNRLCRAFPQAGVHMDAWVGSAVAEAHLNLGTDYIGM